MKNYKTPEIKIDYAKVNTDICDLQYLTVSGLDGQFGIIED